MTERLDKLLVLDLDETLIYATGSRIDDREFDFSFDNYFVYKRPYLDHFLAEVSRHFTLAIWSSAGDQYVSEIASWIKPAGVEYAFVWDQSKCSVRRNLEHDTYYFEKRLAKLKKKGYRLESILMVDDTSEKVACNYGNAIYIKEYRGDANDRELLALLDYLLTLKEAENVRKIEKRFWRKTHGDPDTTMPA